MVFILKQYKLFSSAKWRSVALSVGQRTGFHLLACELLELEVPWNKSLVSCAPTLSLCWHMILCIFLSLNSDLPNSNMMVQSFYQMDYFFNSMFMKSLALSPMREIQMWP